MNPEKWQEVKRIFNEAVEMPPVLRAAFLSGACLDDAELLAEVENLIAADAESETLPDVISVFDARHTFVDKYIDKYRVTRELGRGGMGVVYLAEREDFEKQVALKIVKHEFASKDLFRRFQNERRILAALEHPYIAKLFDGGKTESGLPFFVMEFVEGEDLLTYCDSRNLPVGERLNIFRKVCEAVSYAHAKLVVHRDLKPSNVLVTKDGSPKLLDFGISKLINEDSPAEETGTVTALGMMTPNYASPEQVRGESVSTATDIYSLGVILFELLTGALPYDVTNRRLDEVVRVICEAAPQKPSEVVGARAEKVILNDSEPKLPAKNQLHSPRPVTRNPKLLRGDLDNIILKSLRKEPERRYASVEKLSDDLRRHLDGLPVAARPDTFSYRAEKFLKRNSGAVAAGLLIFLTLVGGIAASTYQSVRVEHQRLLAEKRFNQVRELANNVVFKYHDAIVNLPGSTEVRQMLVTDATNYLDNLAQDSNNDSALQLELAKAYLKLADVQGKTYYSNVGDTKGSIENYRKAATLLENLSNTAADAETRALSKTDLITVYQTLGMMQSRIFAHDESIATQRKALSLVEEKLSLAPGDEKLRYQHIRANGRLADSLRGAGHFAEAMAQFRKTLALAENLHAAAPENQDAETAIGVLNDRLGLNLTLRAAELRKIDFMQPESDRLLGEARRHLEKMFDVFTGLAAKYPQNKKYKRDLSTAYLNLGMNLRYGGNLNRSLELLKKDLEFREQVVASDAADREAQADLAEGLTETAMTLGEKNDFENAFAHLRRGLEILDRLNEKDTLNSEFQAKRFELANNYGDILRKKGEISEAINVYQSALAELKKNANSSNQTFLLYAEGVTQENLGDIYRQSADKQKGKQETEKIKGFYQKALALWRDAEIQRGYLNRTPERLDFLKRKITDCELILAKL